MKYNSNVLFVDGEISVLESIKRMLLAENRQAFFASSMEEAEKCINEQSIDVMFVDIATGNLVELLDKVQDTNPDIVKVVISDFSHLTRIINSIRKLNVHSFLLKPWKKQELLETLESAEDYAIFVKTQANEKENLKQKNVIYQRIINFKDDVGESNKVDITALKSALYDLTTRYEELIKSEANIENMDIRLRNLAQATEMFSVAFPTFVEKFSVAELLCSFKFDDADIICENQEITYIKNLTLIKELITRAYKYINYFYHVGKIYVNLYPEEKLYIRFDFACDNELISPLKEFLEYLSTLLKNIECSLVYEIKENEQNNVNITFGF